MDIELEKYILQCINESTPNDYNHPVLYTCFLINALLIQRIISCRYT